MSSLCDIFPDDPSCVQVEPEEPAVVVEPEKEEPDNEEVEDVDEAGVEDDENALEDEPASDAIASELSQGNYAAAALKAVDEWANVKALKSYAMLSPVLDHLKLIMVAGIWAASGGLAALRYRSESNFYDSGKIGDETNWWKLGDQLRNYSGLGVGGVLALTSLLATFGIANSVNMMAWEFLGLGSALVSLAIFVVRFLGYDAAYGHAKGTDVAKQASGKAVMGYIKEDSLMDAAMEVGSLLALASAKEGVAFDLWHSLNSADQAEKIADWEQTVAERAQEIAVDRKSLDGPKKENKNEKIEDSQDEEK